MSAPLVGVDYYVISSADYNTLALWGTFTTFLSYFSQSAVDGYYYASDPAVANLVWDVMDEYPELMLIRTRYILSTQSWDFL